MKKLIWGCMASLLATSAVAGEGDLAINVGLGAGFFEYNQPEFTTDVEQTVFPSLGVTWGYSSLDRVSLNIRLIDEEIESGGGEGVGMSIKGQQFVMQWHHKLRLSRHFKPWIGIGVVSNSLSAEDKFKTDSDGFLVESYRDTDETAISGIVSAEVDIEMSDKFFIVPKIAYEFPFDDGPQGISFGVTVKYLLLSSDD